MILKKLLLVLSILLIYSPAHSQTKTFEIPAELNDSSYYLLFFHNYYVETTGPKGDCKYYDILESFHDMGFQVISEIRTEIVSPVDYSKTAAAKVASLIERGVAPQEIFVAGHSKGGVIALNVAAHLKNPDVHYIIMAGCEIAPLFNEYPAPSDLKGDFLSLLSASDSIAGSCKTFFSKARTGFGFKEIRLEDQSGHRLFFTPEPVWIIPVRDWVELNRSL